MEMRCRALMRRTPELLYRLANYINFNYLKLRIFAIFVVVSLRKILHTLCVAILMTHPRTKLHEPHSMFASLQQGN